MNKISPLIFLFLLGSCQKAELNFGIANDYFPSADLLSEGIVNKYYVHTQFKDEKDIGTHLIYESLQVVEDKLYIRQFNPDFSPISKKQYEFQNNQMILLEDKRFVNHDTVKYTLVKPVTIDWEHSEGGSEKKIHYKDLDFNISSKQLENKDTSLFGLPAKVFVYEGLNIEYTSSDTIKTSFTSENTYVEGLGFFQQKFHNQNLTQWLELAEQIPLKTFEKMASIPRHRVAYIDPEKTLDNKESFQTCNSIDRIYDYYNGQQISYYQGGKKAIMKAVTAQLDNQKMHNESGYLTFRFVVNCKGEAGRIITEQADLDFQRKEFNEITVTHFYQIFQQLDKWIPIKNRQKDTVDAYFYLTFKLKDGKLIELLP